LKNENLETDGLTIDSDVEDQEILDSRFMINSALPEITNFRLGN